MIKARAKKATAVIKKPVSNVDKSIATSRARREAAQNHRRGLAASSKPTQMEIDTQVKKQAHKTALKKTASIVPQKQSRTNAPKPATPRLGVQEKAERRREQRDVLRAGKLVAATAAPIVLPTKKMYKAARAALISEGYTFPPQYEIQVAPKLVVATTPPPPPKSTARTNPRTKSPKSTVNFTAPPGNQHMLGQSQPKRSNRRGGGKKN